MTRPNPADANWKRLSRAARFQAVAHASKTISPKSLGAGVKHVGFGYRLRRPKGKPAAAPRQLKEPVLVALVEQKLSKSAAAKLTAKQRIAESVTVDVEIDGEMQPVAVPIDVNELPPPPQVQALPNSTHVERQSGQTVQLATDGSFAAILTDGSHFYLLSAHHVLKPGATTTQRRISRAHRAYLIEQSRDAPATFGTHVCPARFAPGRANSLDAAVIRLQSDTDATDAAIDAAFWSGLVAEAIDSPEALAEAALTRYTLHGLAARRVRLRFKHVIRDMPIPYQIAGRTVSIPIAEVIVSQSTHRGQISMPGDSGGAVALGSLLLGMHIAGNPVDRHSYAIPTYRLIGQDVFAGLGPLSLVPIQP